MIPEKNRHFSGVLVALLIFTSLTLGACAKKPAETTTDSEVSVSGQDDGSSGQYGGQDDQMGQRDPGYADDANLRDVFFEFDRSELTPDSRDILQANADWINSNAGMKVQIEGHCDERGTEEYNLALGERRANSVKNYLMSLGVEEHRLFTISYGEELPAEQGHDESSWSKNRRAHFLVTK